MGTQYSDKEVIPIPQYCKDSMIFRSARLHERGYPGTLEKNRFIRHSRETIGVLLKKAWKRNPLWNHEQAGQLSPQQREEREERGTGRNRDERDLCRR